MPEVTEFPFHEIVALFERAKQRGGFDDDICICGRLGAPAPHLCNMRYRIAQSQLEYEIANFPSYPRCEASA